MKVSPKAFILNKREGKTVFRLLGLLEEYLESELDCHVIHGTGSIINSAKVEVDLVKAVGDCVPGSSFFVHPEEKPLPEKPRLRQISRSL